MRLRQQHAVSRQEPVISDNRSPDEKFFVRSINHPPETRAGVLFRAPCGAGRHQASNLASRGYESYLDALADPKHPEHESMLDWRDEFDSDEFDVYKMNQELAKLVRWSRPRNR